jgi:hypothetical protein
MTPPRWSKPADTSIAELAHALSASVLSVRLLDRDQKVITEGMLIAVTAMTLVYNREEGETTVLRSDVAQIQLLQDGLRFRSFGQYLVKDQIYWPKGYEVPVQRNDPEIFLDYMIAVSWTRISTSASYVEGYITRVSNDWIYFGEDTRIRRSAIIDVAKRAI